MGLKLSWHPASRDWRWLIPVILAFLLAACAGPSGNVAIDDRGRGGQPPSQPVTSGSHTVQRGDTLYSIAFRYGWDWRQLAANNAIAAPYTIYPGQQLSLRPGYAGARPPATASSRPTTTASTSSSRPAASTPAPASTPRSEPTPPRPSPPPASSSSASVSGWSWPAEGPLIARFQSNDSLNKGIDIAGDLGQPVKAAASGSVVYAGRGLIGYGEMVIIKHNDTYLSAYAHNNRLLVDEGDSVRAGQTIAEMGSTGTDRVKLHFEIRQRGQPVDPLRYLPKR
ncbi:MAG: peptidoglycan DD-metalloendopeptidase family protein [Gammaproteobacteria bacterium]|nr:peptidoglycan DD-metalloendopeptidase family protein [Gammaproteobacteria bacterium]